MAERIMSMKNSSDNIGNRTRDLPACSAVPQPTVPPRASHLHKYEMKIANMQSDLKMCTHFWQIKGM